MKRLALEGTLAGDRERQQELAGQQLLPGLPDHITLKMIVSKVGREMLPVLNAVSWAWTHAIRTRQVYEARIQAQSTEDFILFVYFDCWQGHTNVVSLYSMKTQTAYQLPPIPNVYGGIPVHCQAVSVDGKVYVLGGRVESATQRGSSKVYLRDLVELRPWRECASMHEPREKFQCGVLGGKIYAFGGCNATGPVGGAEVYDPKKNTWTWITPIVSRQCAYLVGVLGDQLQTLELDGGDDDWEEDPANNNVDAAWKPEGVGFISHGKLHSLSGDAIQVYDDDTNEWRKVHLCKFAGFGGNLMTIFPLAVVPVEDKIFALVDWSSEGQHGSCLVGGTGLGSKEQEEILFQPVELGLRGFTGVSDSVYSPYPFQL
ncbi:unnamed protein product [Calypogeia fissa]